MPLHSRIPSVQADTAVNQPPDVAVCKDRCTFSSDTCLCRLLQTGHTKKSGSRSLSVLGKRQGHLAKLKVPRFEPDIAPT